MINKYFSIFKKNIEEFTEKNKLKEQFDLSVIDIIIKYICKGKTTLDIYIKDIEFNPDVLNILIDKIKETNEKILLKVSEAFEKQINRLKRELDKQIKNLKDISK